MRTYFGWRGPEPHNAPSVAASARSAVARHHNVVRLQIAMGEFGCMGPGESFGNLVGSLQGVPQRKLAWRRFRRLPVGNYVGLTVVAANVAQRQNVRTIQSGHYSSVVRERRRAAPYSARPLAYPLPTGLMFPA